MKIFSEASTLHCRHIKAQGEGQQSSAAGPAWLVLFAEVGEADHVLYGQLPASVPRTAQHIYPGRASTCSGCTLSCLDICVGHGQWQSIQGTTQATFMACIKKSRDG